MKTKTLSVIVALIASGTLVQGTLVLHLNFDDEDNLFANSGSGTVAWGGTNNDGQVAGRFGAGALQMLSSNDVYTNQGGTNINTTLNLFTISMHIRQIPGGTANMSNWNDFASFGTDNNSGFKFEFNGSHQGASVYTDGTPGGGSITIAAPDGPDVNDGEWHHLALVSNGSMIEFFINGISQGSDSYTGTDDITLDAIQLAGAYGAGRKQNVQIDDLAIWNEALNVGQIAWLTQNAAIASPIPEPSAALLGAFGFLGLLRRRRA